MTMGLGLDHLEGSFQPKPHSDSMILQAWDTDHWNPPAAPPKGCVTSIVPWPGWVSLRHLKHGRALLQNGQAERQQLNLYVWAHLTRAFSCDWHMGTEEGRRWMPWGRDTCHPAGTERAEASPERQLLLSFPRAHI